MIIPFEVEELEARIRAIARRLMGQGKLQHVVGDLLIDVPAHRVQQQGVKVSLSQLEFQLLEYLARTPDRARTRTEILEHVWGSDYNPGTNVIPALVRRLRGKLQRQDGTQPIKTVNGVGYLIESNKASKVTGLSPQSHTPETLIA